MKNELLPGLTLLSRDGRMHPTPGVELSRNPAPFRFRGGDKIFQHPIDRVLVKDTDVAVGQDITLQGFQLEH